MKKKDILTVVVCLVVIVFAGFYLYSSLAPKKTVETNLEANYKIEPEFTGNIDEKTLEEVKNLNDYGEATLDNIGRTNPFGSLN